MPAPHRKTESQEKASLALLLAGAFVLQLALLAVTKGYRYDTATFTAWALRIANDGPAVFYGSDYFADYPPGYILLLWPAGKLLAALSLRANTPQANLLLGLLPALAGCAIAALIWRIARAGPRPQFALRMAALAAFGPGLWFCTAVWKQVDTVFILPLLLCFWLLEQKRYLPAALSYGVALAVKPQALMAGPVLAVCFLALLKGSKIRAMATAAAGALLALLMPFLAGLPFWGAGTPTGLWQKYFAATQTYPYAAVNAFNLPLALGGNWADQSDRFALLTWQQWGTAAIALLTLGMLLLAYQGLRARRFSPLMLAAVYLTGLFTFSHQMHERYLLPGMVLVLAAAARRGDRRLAVCGAGLNLLCFLNQSAVYSVCGSDDEWLTSALSRAFSRTCGLAETLLCCWLFAVVCRMTRTGHYRPLARAKRAAHSPQPWARTDTVCLAGLTLFAAVTGFWDLGDLSAPQTVFDTIQAPCRPVTVTVEGEPARLWVYTGIQTGGSLTVTDGGGNIVLAERLEPGDCFKWTEYGVAPITGGRFTVTVDNGRIIEMAFRGQDGALLPVTDPAGSQLFDEQALIPGTISYKNSFYFDEIYHARTGYEQLHGMPVYETTHPPLGKDFIMLGIALFGMNGFGWRFFGTLFGVLMIPVFYLLVRRVTGLRAASACGTAMLALDFMRFTQSRMATIDTYVVFFILLSAYGMVWYCQRMQRQGVLRAWGPLALSGVAFGLACASKWTGLYAGAGLAVVFFVALYHRLASHPKAWRRDAPAALTGGVVFFVLVPVLIYLASYLPYRWGPAPFTLDDWWQAQQSMYRYHSMLDATHPFQSGWYTWPLDLRPVWYYASADTPGGLSRSIAGFYSPLLAWAGLAGVLLLAARGIARGFGRRDACILVMYLAQLAPWMLVSRCVFLYHYWAGSLFALLALCTLLADGYRSVPRSSRRLMAGLCGLSALLFAAFYPVLSGLAVPAGWIRLLRLLPSWTF